MIMDGKIESITVCIAFIKSGLTESQFTDVVWLKTFIRDLAKSCKIIRSECHFTTELTSNLSPGSDAHELLLACMQIASCTPYILTSIKLERSHKCSCLTSRKYMLERILWALEKVRSHIQKTDASTKGAIVQIKVDNFVDAMDYALELIEPYTLFYEPTTHESLNENTDHQEHVAKTSTIRSYVDVLLSHAMSYSKFVVHKNNLRSHCYNIMQQCLAFQLLFTDHPAGCVDELRLKEYPPDHDVQTLRQMRATALDMALFKLDVEMNETLLVEVLRAFVYLRTEPLVALREYVEKEPLDDNKVEKMVAEFDGMMELLVEVARISVSFTSNIKAKMDIHHAIVTLEALEDTLIPAVLFKPNRYDAATLVDYWSSTVHNLQTTIHQSIETSAFCRAADNLIQPIIGRMKDDYSRHDAQQVLHHCRVLAAHIKCNKLDEKPMWTKQFQQLSVVLEECGAAINVCDPLEPSRIRKRFKLLRAVVSGMWSKNNLDGGQRSPSITVDKYVPLCLVKDNSRQRSIESNDLDRNYLINDQRTFVYAEKPLTGSAIKMKMKRMERKPSLRSKLFARYKPESECPSTSSQFDVNHSLDLEITNILNGLKNTALPDGDTFNV